MNLPKTRLRLDDDLLIKYDAAGDEVSSIKISDIQSVEMTVKYEVVGALMLMVPGAALAWASWSKIEHEWWSWAGTIVFAGLASLAALGIKCTCIDVTTDQGSVQYPVNDTQEDAAGFLIALRQRLEERGA